MNLQIVITNLRNTIASKEAYLAQMEKDIVAYNQTVNYAVAKYLRINIDELNRILDDLVECEVKGKEFSTWAHWQQNPDRSGGQFTDEEIARGSEWR